MDEELKELAEIFISHSLEISKLINNNFCEIKCSLHAITTFIYASTLEDKKYANKLIEETYEAYLENITILAKAVIKYSMDKDRPQIETYKEELREWKKQRKELE